MTVIKWAFYTLWVWIDPSSQIVQVWKQAWKQFSAILKIFSLFHCLHCGKKMLVQDWKIWRRWVCVGACVWDGWGKSWRRVTTSRPVSWTQSMGGSSTLSLSLKYGLFLLLLLPEDAPRTKPWDNDVVLRAPAWHVWLKPVKALRCGGQVWGSIHLAAEQNKPCM